MASVSAKKLATQQKAPQARASQAKASLSKAKTKTSPIMNAKKRHSMIEIEAYRIAEQRNFLGDSAMDDWLQAEKAVDEKILDTL